MSLLVQSSGIGTCQGSDTLNLTIGTGATVPVTAGNDLVVYLAISSYIGSAPTITVKEGATSYTQIVSVTDSGSWPIFAIFRLANVSAGTHTPVITVTNGVGSSYGQAKVCEYKPLGTVDQINTAQGNSNAPSVVLPNSGTFANANDTILSICGGSDAIAMAGMGFPFGAGNNIFQDTSAVTQPCSFDTEALTSNAQITISYGTLTTAQHWDVVAASFQPGSTTPVSLLGAASATVAAAAALTQWAQVTLVAPLYAGTGGVLDPNFWFDSVPVAGTLLFYDPTFITILPNGEINSTAQNCRAVVQFFDSHGVNAWGVVFFQGTNVGYADPKAVATGAFSSSFLLSANAAVTSTATGKLSPISLTAAASVHSVASGVLTPYAPAWSSGVTVSQNAGIALAVNLNSLASSPQGLGLSFQVGTGALPPGVQLVGGSLVGTPSTPGSYQFTIIATDTFGRSTPSPLGQIQINVAAPGLIGADPIFWYVPAVAAPAVMSTILY